MPRFSFGALAVPDGWDVQLQLELREPQRPLAAAAPTLHKPKPAPATNVIVRRGVSASTPASCADALLGELRTSTSTLRAQAPAEVVFEDGAAGVALELSFQAAQLTVVQRHLFRTDAGVVTHLCATVNDARALAPLGPLLLSFTPS